jgi:hypothetical protein
MMRSFEDHKKKYPESHSATFDLFKLPSTDEPTFAFYPKSDGGSKFQASKHGQLFKYMDGDMKSVAEPLENFRHDGSKK